MNLYETASVATVLAGRAVTVEQETRPPWRGGATLRFRPAPGDPRPVRAGVRLRVPSWAHNLHVREHPEAGEDTNGWLDLEPRDFGEDDLLHVDFDVGPYRIAGTHGNAGKVALVDGPFVLAYATGAEGRRRLPALDVVGPDAVVTRRDDAIEMTASITNRFDGLVDEPTRFVPFAQAGADGAAYRVWIAADEPRPPISLLTGGTETRSSGTIGHGSAIDGEAYSFVSTYDGREHAEEWVGVIVDAPIVIDRVEVGHGWSWVNGGWFDTSAGKPIVEVQAAPGELWQPVGRLIDYPTTTQADPGGLVGGEVFVLRLDEPIVTQAVRVRGVGSSGGYPPQRYVTVGLLAVYGPDIDAATR